MLVAKALSRLWAKSPLVGTNFGNGPAECAMCLEQGSTLFAAWIVHLNPGEALICVRHCAGSVPLRAKGATMIRMPCGSEWVPWHEEKTTASLTREWHHTCSTTGKRSSWRPHSQACVGSGYGRIRSGAENSPLRSPSKRQKICCAALHLQGAGRRQQ